MADEVSEHDTFVSVDIYAPTQSSIGALDQDDDDQDRDLNDTRSLSEYIGDGGEDLLADDILDSVNLNADTTQNSATLDDSLSQHAQSSRHTDTQSSIHPSPQFTRAMRQDSNRHDSAFMWTLSTGEPSPEMLRENNDSTSHSVGPADTLTLQGVEDAIDDQDVVLDGDVCANFNTANFSDTQISGPERVGELSQDHDSRDSPVADELVPPTPNSHRTNSKASPYTPARSPQSRRRDSTASQPSPTVPCSSERPPLPPAHPHDMLTRRRSSVGRTMMPSSSHQVGNLQSSPGSSSSQYAQSSPGQSQTPQGGMLQAQSSTQPIITPAATAAQVAAFSTPMSENSMMAHDPKFDEASHGYISGIVSNPFSDNEVADWPKEIVIISRTGPIDGNDKKALADLAASDNMSASRVVRRLIETIVFQCRQLDHVKDSEVNLAGSILNEQLRRYSDAAHERSFAFDELIEEVDSQRECISELEEENDKLKKLLSESENKVKQVEDYYSNIVNGFNLSGNVVTALESVHGGIEKFRRESIEQSEKDSTQVEDYARRLLEMEDIVADSRKRMKRMEAENEELHSALHGSENVERKTPVRQNDDEEATVDSPARSGRYASPDRVRAEEQAEYLRTIEEQHIEIDNLRLLNSKADEDHKKMQDAFLNLNVEMEESRSKVTILQKQRDSAESKNRELATKAANEKKKFVQLFDEMSKEIVQVVNELDQREKEMRSLRIDLEDRESVLRSLQCTNQDLEDQLQAFTEAALDRSQRSRSITIEGSNAQPLVDTFIESLQKELNKSQALLHERTNEIDRVKKVMQDQDESIIALQKECSRLQAQAAVRRRSGSSGSPRSVSTSVAEEERFLRRLSQKLGCTQSNGNRDLIEQLAKRVETLMVEREQFHEQLEKMRSEVSDRERGLHKLRSEMQAEISALKAEAVHQENLKVRAQDERKIAEERLLHVLNEGDISRRESLGDITASSVGTRAWMMQGDESGDDMTRRTSILSATGTGVIPGTGEETIRWNDPIIESAVHSVNALIGTKDALADRNRELREKLQALVNALAANDQDGSARAVIIQSKEMQDELTGVVGMQQDIIEKLAQSHANATQALRPSLAGERASADNTLALISQDNTGNLLASPVGSQVARTPLGEATRFLNEQLQSTRNMYSDKLRANAELCGAVEELREDVRRHLTEIDQYKAENHNIEIALSQLQETHNGFVARLSVMTGADRSCVALEDFIRASLHDLVTLKDELEKRDIDERVSMRRNVVLLAQKRFLSHIISLYQNKYRLNILADSDEERQSLKRRLRVKVFAVIAVNKLMALKSITEESNGLALNEVSHDLPHHIDIANAESSDVCLMEATLALSAVPRLERALVEKEEQVSRLESSIEALNRSAASQPVSTSSSDHLPRSSFVYEEDMLNRKNDLSRRLQKMIREKEELEERLSREKQARLTAEARAVKYMERVSTYKKRIGKITSHAESKENTYKTAIRYLKSKADKAVKNDFNMNEENVAPLESLQSEAAADGNSANATTRAMLQEKLNVAENEMADMDQGAEGYETLKGYVQGLRLAIQRLEKPLVFNRSRREANRA